MYCCLEQGGELARYKFKLRDNFTFNFEPYLSPQQWQEYLEGREFFQAKWADQSGRVWLSFDCKTKEFTISKGYAWDGCSPKIFWGDWLCIGTPDGNVFSHTGLPKAYSASLCHDVLYQFRNCLSQEGYRLPGTRKQYDLLFRNELRKTNFSLTGFYYFIVRNLGELYARLAEFFRPFR